MASECEMQEKIDELSNLLRREKDLRVREQRQATEREKGLRAEMESLRETVTNKNLIKIKALQRERDSLSKEVLGLKMHVSTIGDVTEECKAETAGKESVTKQNEDLQKEVEQLKLELHDVKDLGAERRLRDSEREKLLRKEICYLKEQLQREREECEASFEPKVKALERENKALITQIEKLKLSLTHKDLSEQDGAESAETLAVKQQETSTLTENEVSEETEQLKLQLKEEKDRRAARQLRDFERVHSLYRKIRELKGQFQREWTECGSSTVSELKAVELLCDLGEQLQKEQNECAASFVSTINLLERENKVFISQMEQVEVSCRENNSTLRDLSKKDKAESAEKVAVEHQEGESQEPDTSAQKEDEVCGQEALANTEEEKVPEQDTCNLLKKLKTDVSQNLDKLQTLDRKSKVLSNFLNQLKISFECLAEKHKAEKAENKALLNVIEDLNSKLQKEMDMCTQLHLKDVERERTIVKEMKDFQETLHKEREQGGKLQAWEKQKAAYLEEIEELNVICEGKGLRIKELLDRLQDAKAHKEAIKEEQFKRIQALNVKTRKLQDSNAQQKLRASDRENFLSLKVRELEEKISDYEKRAHTNVSASEDLSDDEPGCSNGKKKTKKRKGWKKFVHNVKPWNWR